MSSLPSALRATLTFSESPTHWNRWCRRDICGKSQRHSASKGTKDHTQQWRQYLLEGCSMSSLQHWLQTAGLEKEWAMNTSQTIPCCTVEHSQLLCFLVISAVKNGTWCHCGLQWEQNFRHWEFTATASWEEGQKDTRAEEPLCVLHTALLHRWYNRRRTTMLLGTKAFRVKGRLYIQSEEKRNYSWNSCGKSLAFVNSSCEKLNSNNGNNNKILIIRS